MFEIDPEYRPQDRIVCSLFLVPAALAIAGAASHNRTLSMVGAGLSLAQGVAGGIAGATTAASSTAAESGAAASESTTAAGTTAASGSTAASSSSSLLSAENLRTGASLAQGAADAFGKYQSGLETEAEAAQLRRQAKIAERQQINKDLDVLGQQKNIATASGVVPTGDSPLAVFADSVRTLEMNAANTRRTGELQANARKAEAGQAYAGIPGAIVNPLLKSSQAKTLLSQFMGRA